jgi:organic radical activating enzyme
MIEQGIELPGLLKMFDKRVIELKLDIDNFKSREADVENIIANLDPGLKQAVHMSLVGGEPLVNKTTTRILEQCVEKGYAKNMMLQIITNLSVINPKTIKMLEQFKYPMLCISYDHINPAKFNFIRYPADYQVFKDNFETLWQHDKIEKKLSTTWSIFNIFDFEEIFQEWETIAQRTSKRFVLNFGLVYYPNYWSLRYLEQEQKVEISDRIHRFMFKNSDWKIFTDNPEFKESVISVPGYMGPKLDDYDEVVKERTRVLDLYDKLRGTDSKTLFPYIKR